MSDDRYAGFSDAARSNVAAEMANMLSEAVPGVTAQQAWRLLKSPLEATADRLIEAWEKGEKIPPGPVKVDKAVQQIAMMLHEEEVMHLPPKIRTYAKKWTAGALGVDEWPPLFYWAIWCRFGRLALDESPLAVPPLPTHEAKRLAQGAGYNAGFYEVRGDIDRTERYERRANQIIDSRGADQREVRDAYLAAKQSAFDDAARRATQRKDTGE